ncbi:hypothetical protein LXA43DRAFT_1089820 [Ganoderma leucocontextum]|nr:hypothetical protein LXA43DRAFT_1089820 [Ganoderma leucocontextum]
MTTPPPPAPDMTTMAPPVTTTAVLATPNITTPTLAARWPARLYILVRIEPGRVPNAKGEVDFKDLYYSLAIDDGVRCMICPLPLHGISDRQGQSLRWAEVMTYTPTMEQTNLPSDQLQVMRELTMLFYLFWTQEEGFTWELYDDVCAAIADYTDYGVPVPPLDRTSLLKALLKYVKGKVGDDWFKPQNYTPGELAVAEEIFHGERTLQEATTRWPTLSLAALRDRSEGPILHEWRDPREKCNIKRNRETVPTMCPVLDREVWDMYVDMPDP